MTNVTISVTNDDGAFIVTVDTGDGGETLAYSKGVISSRDLVDVLAACGIQAEYEKQPS